MDLKLINKLVTTACNRVIHAPKPIPIRNFDKLLTLCAKTSEVRVFHLMKSLVASILYSIFICASLQSCSYSPDGIFENPVNRDINPPEIQALKLNLSTDTIYLYNAKKVVFEFASNNEKQEIERVHFFIDGIFDVDVYSKTGEFKLEWGNIPEGSYTLKLDVYTHSGTNSIADKVGAESFLFTKSWNIFVNKSYYTQIKSNAVDGYLHVVWPKYKNLDFVEYVVYRGFDYYSKREIGRVTTCDFIDSSYVGESARYFVEVVIDGEDQLQWGSLELNYEMPNLKLNLIDKNRTALVWNKSKYYSAIESCIFSMADYWYLDYHVVKTFTSSIDTVYVLPDSLFGFKPYFQLEIVPRIKTADYYSGNREYYMSRKELQVGYSFMNFTRYIPVLAQTSKDQFFFLVDCDSIYRYSVLEKRIVDKLGFSYTTCIGCSFNRITLSSSGNYLTSYTPCTSEVVKINANNFDSYEIQDLKSYTENYVFQIPVADNGLCIANTADKGFHVYDFNSKSAISLFAGESGNAIGLKISTNGRYFLVTDNDFKLIVNNGSTFETIATFPRFPELPYFEFDALNPELVYYWDGSTFFIKNCSDFSTINQYSLIDSAIKSVDFYNKRLLSFNSDVLYVRDLITGEILHHIPTYKNPNMWWGNCCLVNNTLVSSSGIIYFFNEN